MITIPGYEISAAIYEGLKTVVYRGHREQDRLPVVVKVHRADYPPSKDVAKFRREYEIGTLFDFNGVIKYYGMEKYGNAEALIEEDFGAVALREIIPPQGTDVPTFLRIAIQLAQALGEVHRKQIIHKDIKPRNIVVNRETLVTKLIDFGISSQLSRENQEILSPNMLEGTLAYMSPEQTGRMNRAIDYRTDFYSLGMTFYEMLTGTLPFEATDAMELVHCHIAQTPIPPHERKTEIPKVLSDLVMKLLEKTAERRYQSTYGLLTDLQKCLTAWESTGAIEAFAMGERDVSARFEIPQKLYGREVEIDTLMAAFDRVSDGAKEMMLVCGYSGIGKSALVNEVHKPIVQKRGYFISGKFDQFKRNIPYAALIQAFAGLIRQLLTESEAQIAAWKEKLLAALGPNRQVIINVIPEVELIIGPQPSVPELPPTETQNRFNLVFGNFIRTFAQKEHPLAIFLDDLQWADSPSLKLIELLVTDPQTQYLFFIGAYRDNEVFEGHPLMLSLDRLQKTQAVVNTIVLQPLALPDLNQLIADTLVCDPPTALPLTELVMGKTGGNPFFVNQFLTAIYAEGLFVFDYERGCWQWEVEKIAALGLTDNVVELMAGKIQKLKAQTQRVLQLAACVGNTFDLHTLSIVLEKSPSDTAADLWEAVTEGLVLPIGDAYKFLETRSNDLSRSQSTTEVVTTDLRVSYQFLHDRVQQAAYSLIPQDQKKAVHLSIGRLMLANISSEEREERIFDIVGQLNEGRELMTDQGERDAVAQLNLKAGVQAKASTAYQPALAYFKVGMGLLGDEGWQRQYELTLALHTEAAEAAYLSGDFELMEELAGAVLKRANTLLDKVKVYEIKIQAYILQDKKREALQTGLEILALLGVRFPKKPTKLHILLGLLSTKLALAGKRIEGLIDLPEMTDPYKLAAMRLLISISATAYQTRPELFPLIVFKQAHLSVKHGNTSESVPAYDYYGIILCGVVGDIDAGYRFGKLALEVLERFNAKEQKCRTYFVFNGFVRHWKEHVRDTLQPYLEGFQSGQETGDIEYGAYCIYQYTHHGLSIGRELAELEREIAKYRPAISPAKDARKYAEFYHQVVLNLMGQVENPCRLVGENYDEAKMLPMYLEVNEKSILHMFYLRKLILCYLFGEYQTAVENAAQAEKYLEAVVGLLEVAQFHFYDSLLKLAVYPDARRGEAFGARVLKTLRVRFPNASPLRKVAQNQKKMKKWAHHAPMNHLHKYYLVEAERARVLGKDHQGMEYYDKAIAGARENEYVNEEALASELAAKFYLERGKEKIASVYMMDARYAYQRWGAMAKVKDLDERYPQLLRRPSDFRSLQDFGSLSETSTTTEGASSALDFQTVMKASQAISGELVLSTLLEKLMQIVIENAGAQRGCLILVKGD